MESDSELIDLANKGDPEAFEKLYYRYRVLESSLTLQIKIPIAINN